MGVTMTLKLGPLETDDPCFVGTMVGVGLVALVVLACVVTYFTHRAA